MRNLSKVMAVILTVVMVCAFSTVAFAAEFAWDGSYTCNGVISNSEIEKDGTFTLSIYTGEDIEVTNPEGAATISMCFKYDKNVVEFQSVEFSAGCLLTESDMTHSNGRIYCFKENVGNMAFAADEAVATFTFKAIADSGSYSDVFMFDNNEMLLSFCNDAYDTFDDSIAEYSLDSDLTIKSTEPVTPVTPATVTAGTATTKTYVGKTSGNTYSNVWFNTYAAVNNDQTITSITLTFNGNTKTLNLGNKLVEGGGSFTFDVAIVGAPANADVDVDFVAVDAE